jgi:divalent metal cation (Fe/Co/Zn/Cd) transporter
VTQEGPERRASTVRFTDGFGKAEDIAGVAILVLIVGSAVFAGYSAIDRLIHPQRITHLDFVMAAAVLGLVIAAAIVVVGYQAAKGVGQRLLDAADPGVVARISATEATVEGVVAVTEVRACWMDHRHLAQVRLSVDGRLPVTQAHKIAEVDHHELLHRPESVECDHPPRSGRCWGRSSRRNGAPSEWSVTWVRSL